MKTHPRSVGRRPSGGARGGFSVGIVLIIVVIVVFMGTGLIQLSGTNAVEASKGVSVSQAFWNAEAGLQEARALARLRAAQGDLEAFPAGSRSWSRTMERGGYSVLVERDNAVSTPAYTITSDGISAGGAAKAVRISTRQMPALSLGLMGLDSLELFPKYSVRSYDSSLTINPVASTGEAKVGSNSEFKILSGVTIDGSISIGSSPDGNEAVFNQSFPDSYVTEKSGYIEPDPLGALTSDGWLGQQFATITSTSVNDNVSAGIVNNRLADSRSGKDTTTLDAGRYYLTTLDISGTLNVNAPGADDMVEIFLRGDAYFGGSVNWIGRPGKLRIYSDQAVTIRASSPPGSGLSVSAFIYAPLGTVNFSPGSNVYGALWAKRLNVSPGGVIWIDMDLLDYYAFGTYRLQYSRWEEVPRMW